MRDTLREGRVRAFRLEDYKAKDEEEEEEEEATPVEIVGVRGRAGARARGVYACTDGSREV